MDVGGIIKGDLGYADTVVMHNERLLPGLFSRLHGSGLHPVLSGELAAANYPTDEHLPLRAPRVRQEAIHWHTENYLDRGTMTLDETWMAIWGVTPHQYLEVAPGSPGARELGLDDVADVQSTAKNWSDPEPPVEDEVDGNRFADAVWFRILPEGSILPRFAGAALPAASGPRARCLADLLCGIALGMASSLDEQRKGRAVAGFNRKAPAGWAADLEALSFAVSVWMMTEKIGIDLLVAGPTGGHYRKVLGELMPDAEHFIAPPSEEPGKDGSALLAKATRLMSESAERRGVRLKNDYITLAPHVMGAYVGGEHGLESLLRTSYRTGLADAVQRLHTA